MRPGAALRRAARRSAAAARSRAALGAGVLDSGFASLAGFVGALYAARVLDGATLGVYALYLSAFMVASLVPQQLLFSPSHVNAVGAERSDRLAILPRMLRTGALLALAGAVLVLPAGWIAAGEVDARAIALLGATAAALTVVSPLQDYLRSTLHLAGRSRLAAALSAVQLGGAIGAVAALHAGGGPPRSSSPSARSRWRTWPPRPWGLWRFGARWPPPAASCHRRGRCF